MKGVASDSDATRSTLPAVVAAPAKLTVVKNIAPDAAKSPKLIRLVELTSSLFGNIRAHTLIKQLLEWAVAFPVATWPRQAGPKAPDDYGIRQANPWKKRYPTVCHLSACPPVRRHLPTAMALRGCPAKACLLSPNGSRAYWLCQDDVNAVAVTRSTCFRRLSGCEPRPGCGCLGGADFPARTVMLTHWKLVEYVSANCLSSAYCGQRTWTPEGAGRVTQSLVRIRSVFRPMKRAEGEI